MGRTMTHVGAAALAAGLFPFTMGFGQEKPKPEQYSAVWVGLGGGNGGSFSIKIRINKYTTDEDIQKFANIVAEGGLDGLRRALQDENAGQLSTDGGVGTPIAIACK